MHFQVTRGLNELSDTELMDEYAKRPVVPSDSGQHQERIALRAEIEKRMAERHVRRCWCQQGQLGALGMQGVAR